MAHIVNNVINASLKNVPDLISSIISSMKFTTATVEMIRVNELMNCRANRCPVDEVGFVVRRFCVD
jgi:hypothetical protein